MKKVCYILLIILLLLLVSCSKTDKSSLVISKKVKQIKGETYRANFELVNVTIPKSVKSIGYAAFYDCRNLTTVNISEGVEFIGESAFENCYSLTKIILPSTIKSIGDFAFRGCRNLAEVVFSDGIVKIGESAFEGCTSLTKITLPSTIKEIENRAFACNNLREVILSEGIEDFNIEDSSTIICSNHLESITYPSSIKRIGSSTIYNTDLGAGTQIIYYSGSKKQWRTEIIFTDVESYGPYYEYQRTNNYNWSGVLSSGLAFTKAYECIIRCSDGEIVYNRQ